MDQETVDPSSDGCEPEPEAPDLDRLLLQLLSHFSEEELAAFAEALDEMDEVKQ